MVAILALPLQRLHSFADFLPETSQDYLDYIREGIVLRTSRLKLSTSGRLPAVWNAALHRLAGRGQRHGLGRSPLRLAHKERPPLEKFLAEKDQILKFEKFPAETRLDTD